MRGLFSAASPAFPRFPSGACASPRALKCPSGQSPIAAILLLTALLSGCNTSALYRDDLYNPPVYWGRHVVQPGETLYSIAWRYGRDYRELGSANGIDPPWNLRAGQVLRLDLRGTVTSGRQNQVATRKSAPASSKPRGAPPAPTPKAAPEPTVTRSPEKGAPLASQTQTVARVNWRWPHIGTVIAGYSTSGKVNKGIDIAGKAGDAVKAAASGNVVYAGNGLLGYGNLIIVNHNEHYLSAYAHNRKILVREGEDVKAGQVIAELGSSGAERPMLHFEIRKNGNPVDPAHYLPRR
ncbi:peptidoglycan DD-metalloendopeptidase family protein [Marinobacter sp. F4218]|uniref:peptidoglycan DD-metalloendopeptidase family protein n=1 Tax=Marinobacter sp. F4218 TaxID=2862868 RepID=UPI001C634999|nr:peptidoglycan DD-metalloendopeptidase family protein [Marinobacter sp. F4218]MBW7469406.1 peptidoglycan DD-metalloendopeptidase family protein [Marinobacter sp. F4218]